MSYIYSQALVAAYSGANCSDIDASALLNESYTHKPSWWHDKTMEPSRHSRFGMTYAPLTESLGADLLMWFAEGFLAKTSALPEAGPDWTEKGQGYGEKWRVLLAKYDRNTHSLKTAQLSLLEDLTGCCATLPRWGLMLDGELYPQPMLELRTSESASGYWPTPNAMLATSSLNFRCSGDGRKKPNKLGWAVAEKIWPTPCASDTGARKTKFSQGGSALSLVAGGYLNPEWVESYLMGWPIGHTDLKPLETGKCQEWQQQHSPCSQEAEAA